MGRKLYLSLVILLFTVAVANAQTGEIKGKVIEAGSNEPIPFASVAATLNGQEVLATQTDFDGNYTLKPLNAGKYDVKVSTVGYKPYMKVGVIVSSEHTSFVDMTMAKGIELKGVDIDAYAIPLIDAGSTTHQNTFDRKDIAAQPTRDVNSVASLGGGVYQNKDGDLNVRGSRDQSTIYIVDGMKVRGSPGLPTSGIEQISVISAGVPASIGDVSGGVITITTRGPSNTYGGSVELATSELLDDYGYNLASANFTGPLLRAKDSTGNKTNQSLIGFFLAGEYQYDKDPSPSSIPIYKVNDELLQDIIQHPLIQSPSGNGYIHRSSFLTESDFVTQKYRENVAQSAARINGKLDFRIAKNFDLTMGGSWENTDNREWTDSYSLMNYDNNPQKTNNKWNAFARITQHFVNSQNAEKSSSVIKNAYYTVQIDYNYSKLTRQNNVHKDKLFDYGYVGKFTQYSAPFFETAIQQDPTPGGTADTLLLFQTSQTGVLYDYHAGTQNPATSNYTTDYYALTDPYGVTGYQDNPSNVEINGGLLNKDNRLGLNVYGIWATPGRVANQYQFAENAQARFTAMGSADIGKHNIQVGIEYEQRTDRGYSVNPNDLWSLMRLLGNQKLVGVDSSTQYITTQNNFGFPTKIIQYEKGKYVPARNKDDEIVGAGFYENIRQLVGLNLNDTVQTDSYDPSIYSLGLFTPDELLNNGNPFINYYGYDYTGKTQTNGSWNLNDFYVNKDENNNFYRSIDAFRPTYTAGYIQDKFDFNDIKFNIGVRVDRFDANQKVLKDPYSLYEIHKAGDPDVAALGPNGTVVPDNIGSDYAVYVNNSQYPSQVVGYRNGSTWYDASGTVTTDLTSLTSGSGAGGIQPYLTNYEDYQKTRVNPNAFTDYDPQVTVMPRVAFSFPISDDAYFAAHYDILTQRQQENGYIRFDPIDYYSWSQGISGNFANPALKPERTTEYEINFQQKLTSASKFSISAFYKELKDMTQIIPVEFAYPIRYTTYGNIDFGTVKGLTFDYDLRRSANVRMTLSYTLQFADGTGSDNTSSSGVIAAQGQANLREIKPLDFDQRHTVVVSFDYHYGEGADYNGPVWFNSQFFANAGANIVFRGGSGTPYTRQSNVTPTADFTTTANSRKVIEGSLNGSRLPWNFRIDMKLDKSFNLVSGGTDDKGVKHKTISANVYLQVLNVLNTQNITSVYAATGSANDDGYIDSPEAQSAINQKTSPQSYIDMYRVAVNSPNNYGAPRRIHLGISVNF
jgi:hypothetical protein